MLNKNYFLVIVSAFLLWLGWPPIPFTGPILLFAFVPLFLALDNLFLQDHPRKGRKVFLLSFTCFLIWNTASIFWVFNSLHAIMEVVPALLISLIPFGLAALLMAVALWLFYRVKLKGGKKKREAFSYVALICFWIAYEYIHQSWDLAFPWMTLGNGFASTHPLIQWYEYTGVYGGTVWILISNILVFETYKAYRDSASVTKKMSIITASVIAVPMLISLLMYITYTERLDPANVVVVQPNIDPFGRFDNFSSGKQLLQLERLSDSVAQKNTEFIIWPETAIASYTEEEQVRSSPYYLQTQQFLQKYKNGNLLSGIESYALYDSAKTRTARYAPGIRKYADTFNAAILIENSAKVQFYHKSKLVPGVEKTPFSSLSFLKPLLAKFGGSTGGYGSQEEPSVFFSGSGIGAGPIICFDSIWGDWVAESVENGAQFIAIITNDGWWGNTPGKDQHFQYAKLRAIETRRWVARSANTGISGFINQRGDVISQSKWWVPTALKADINLNEELTFYVRHGDFLALIGCFGSGTFCMFLLVSAFRRAKS